MPISAPPRLHGWAFSPFLRAVRLALLEKGVIAELEEMTPGDTGSPAFLAISPFGKIPVFRHGPITIVETIAILHHVETSFPGPALLPADPLARARALEVMLATANHLYPVGVMGVFFGHAYVEANGGTPDAAAVARAAEATAPVLDALAARIAGPCVLASGFSLADVLLAPMIDTMVLAPAGARLVGDRPVLAAWWQGVRDRPSLAGTRVPIPRFGLPG